MPFRGPIWQDYGKTTVTQCLSGHWKSQCICDAFSSMFIFILLLIYLIVIMMLSDIIKLLLPDKHCFAYDNMTKQANV